VCVLEKIGGFFMDKAIRFSLVCHCLHLKKLNYQVLFYPYLLKCFAFAMLSIIFKR
jgi:hypothetical protein